MSEPEQKPVVPQKKQVEQQDESQVLNFKNQSHQEYTNSHHEAFSMPSKPVEQRQERQDEEIIGENTQEESPQNVYGELNQVPASQKPQENQQHVQPEATQNAGQQVQGEKQIEQVVPQDINAPSQIGTSKASKGQTESKITEKSLVDRQYDEIPIEEFGLEDLFFIDQEEDEDHEDHQFVGVQYQNKTEEIEEQDPPVEEQHLDQEIQPIKQQEVKQISQEKKQEQAEEPQQAEPEPKKKKGKKSKKSKLHQMNQIQEVETKITTKTKMTIIEYERPVQPKVKEQPVSNQLKQVYEKNPNDKTQKKPQATVCDPAEPQKRVSLKEDIKLQKPIEKKNKPQTAGIKQSKKEAKGSQIKVQQPIEKKNKPQTEGIKQPKKEAKGSQIKVSKPIESEAKTKKRKIKQPKKVEEYKTTPAQTQQKIIKHTVITVQKPPKPSTQTPEVKKQQQTNTFLKNADPIVQKRPQIKPQQQKMNQSPAVSQQKAEKGQENKSKHQKKVPEYKSTMPLFFKVSSNAESKEQDEEPVIVEEQQVPKKKKKKKQANKDESKREQKEKKSEQKPKSEIKAAHHSENKKDEASVSPPSAGNNDKKREIQSQRIVIHLQPAPIVQRQTNPLPSNIQNVPPVIQEFDQPPLTSQIIAHQAYKERMGSTYNLFLKYVQNYTRALNFYKKIVDNVSYQIQRRKDSKQSLLSILTQYFQGFAKLNRQFSQTCLSIPPPEPSSLNNPFGNMKLALRPGFTQLVNMRKVVASQSQKINLFVTNNILKKIQMAFQAYFNQIWAEEKKQFQRKKQHYLREKAFYKVISQVEKTFKKGLKGKFKVDILTQLARFVTDQVTHRQYLNIYGRGILPVRQVYKRAQIQLFDSLQQILNEFKTESKQVYAIGNRVYDHVQDLCQLIKETTKFDELSPLTDIDYIRYVLELQERKQHRIFKTSHFESFLDLTYLDHLVGDIRDVYKGAILKVFPMTLPHEELVHTVSGNLVHFNRQTDHCLNVFVIENINARIIAEGTVEFDELLKGIIFDDNRTVRVKLIDNDRAEELICYLNEKEEDFIVQQPRSSIS